MPGLVKLAQSLDAWVVTDGFYHGVTKMVGDVLSKETAEDGSGRLPCIGVCSWNRVRNRDVLKVNSTDRNSLQMYDMQRSDEQDGTKLLDPNHTHFFMFDDGTYREQAHLNWLDKFLKCMATEGRFSQ